MNNHQRIVTPKENKILPKGLSRAKDLEALGFSRMAIGRMLKRGQLERVSRGVYSTPEDLGGVHRSLAQVSLLAPNAAICLLSALEFHNLTTQLPFEVWIAVPSRSRKPKLEGVRVQFFDAKYFDVGLKTVEIEGVSVRVYDAARTVADCFKYRHKISLDVALEALKQGFSERRFTPDELWIMAGVCRVQKVITPYLEAVSA